MTDRQSQVKIGPQPIGAVQKSEGDNVDEYLGYFTFSTTGEALVPREWLVEKFEEYGLPKHLLPRKPTDWSAYRRTMRSLLDSAEDSHYSIYNEDYEREFSCKLQLEHSDHGGSNVFICYANVFFPEDIIGEEGGDWRKTRLGHFDFRSEDEGFGGPVTKTVIENNNVHYEAWRNLATRARERFHEMKQKHNHSDLQKILSGFRSRANAVEIRRAVYFIGVHREDEMEGLSQLWKEMNLYKDDGEEMRIETSPVVNLESQRKMISQKAEEMVRETIEDLVEEVFDSWDEDETSDSIARTLMEDLSEEGVLAGVSEYNQLLQARLSVKNILKDQMEEMKEDEQKVIENVLQQKKISET